MFILCDLPQVAWHGKEEGRSQMIGRDPKTEVAPSSRQRKKEKRKLVVGQGSWRWELKPRTPVKEEPVKEERFSTGIHRNKISKLWDCFSLHPILYTLSLSFSSWRKTEKRKKRKEERHLCSWTIHLWYIWHVEGVYLCVVKDWYILMFPRARSCYLQRLLRICY